MADAGGRGILPVETLEIVFKYLDGKSLLRSRQVSSVWKEAIDEWMQHFDANQWQWLCHETISSNNLIDFLQTEVPLKASDADKIYKEIDYDLQWVDWKRVFRTFQKLHAVNQWKKKTMMAAIKTETFNDPVTCIKVSGNVCLTGHNSGLLCFWNLEAGVLIDIDHQLHVNPISQIVLGDVFHKAPYDLGQPELKSNCHFSISASRQGKVQARGMAVSSIVGDELLSNSETLELASQHLQVPPFVQINLLGRCLVIWSGDNSICIWSIEVPEHFARSARKLPRFLPAFNLKGPDSILFMATLWPNNFFPWIKKMIVTTRNGRTKVLHNATNDRPRLDQCTWISPKGDQGMSLIDHLNASGASGKTVDIHDPGHFSHKSIKVKLLPKEHLFKMLGNELNLAKSVIWSKVFHDDLFAMISSENELLLSIDGVYFKTCSSRVHGLKVTCVTYFANLFLVGFCNGLIRFYFIKNGGIDFINLDLDKDFGCEFNTGSMKSIIDLDFCTGALNKDSKDSLEQSHVTLVATTESVIYVFEL